MKVLEHILGVIGMIGYCRARSDLHRSDERMRREGKIVDIGGCPTYIGNLSGEEITALYQRAEEARRKREFDAELVGPRKPRERPIPVRVTDFPTNG